MSREPKSPPKDGITWADTVRAGLKSWKLAQMREGRVDPIMQGKQERKDLMDQAMGPEYLDPTGRQASTNTDMLQDYYAYKNLAERNRIVESKTKK